MISIIVPTYNEAKNVRRLIPLLSEVMSIHNYEIVIVDDSSPDGTAEIAKSMAELYPVRVLVRKNERGLASAIVHGFKNAEGDILAVIDADLQHPPELLRDMVKLIMKGYDIVVASRYVDGGGVENWPFLRRLMSKVAIVLARPLTSISDPMSGYFALKRKVIENVDLNPIGYKILLEILVKGKYDKIIEIPYVFRTREVGSSKMGIGEIFNYIRHLYHLYTYKLMHERSSDRD